MERDAKDEMLIRFYSRGLVARPSFHFTAAISLLEMPYTDAFTEENNPFQQNPPLASSSRNEGGDVFGPPSSAATPRRRSLFTSDGFSPAKRSSSKFSNTPQRFSVSSSSKGSQSSVPLFTSSSSTTETSASPTLPESLVEKDLSFLQNSSPSASTSKRKSSGGFPKQPPAAAQDAHTRIDKLEAQLKDFQGELRHFFLFARFTQLTVICTQHPMPDWSPSSRRSTIALLSKSEFTRPNSPRGCLRLLLHQQLRRP